MKQLELKLELSFWWPHGDASLAVGFARLLNRWVCFARALIAHTLEGDLIFVDDAVRDGVSREVLGKLALAETLAGFEFEVTSGFREGDVRYHGAGEAVDLRCWNGPARFEMLTALLAAGFKGIGVYDRHIHADVRKGDGFLWTGVSK